MDIHPPKHPVLSLREFLLEIFTVTCGIVIALSLESAVQYSHALHLRQQTRDDFAVEIQANEATLQTRLAAAAADQAMVLGLIEYGTIRLAHRTAPPPKFSGRAFSTLPSDAWQTALATQGVGQLTHAEVNALSAAYDAQASFNALQQQELTQWVQIAGFGDVDALTDDEIRLALRDLRVVYALSLSSTALEHKLIAHYDAAARKLTDAR